MLLILLVSEQWVVGDSKPEARNRRDTMREKKGAGRGGAEIRSPLILIGAESAV